MNQPDGISHGNRGTVTAEQVAAMVQRIVDKFSPEKVVIFGSWARGEAHQHSDVDFLVIMPYQGSKRDAQVAIRLALNDFDTPKDVIVASPEEIQEKQNIKGYIYRPALLEGKVAYERQRNTN